jgi:predicted Zn-dependent protease
VFGTLQHSRHHEAEADVAGLRLLVAAGIDPTGMVRMFARLQEQEQHTPALLQYLSSHPRTAQRIATLTTLASQATGPFVKLLPYYNWEDMHHICTAVK